MSLDEIKKRAESLRATNSPDIWNLAKDLDRLISAVEIMRSALEGYKNHALNISTYSGGRELTFQGSKQVLRAQEAINQIDKILGE